MKKALILQGWKQDVNSNFYPWLKEELEKKGYQVFLPELYTMMTDSPEMIPQLMQIEKLLDIDEETIIFGHSITSVLAMRLAEKYKYKSMFLIAGWDFNDLTPEHQSYWPTPLNHQKIKEHVKNIYCLSSENDPYMTAFTVQQMAGRLDGKFILVKGAGHFTNEYGVDKIPEILEFI